MWIIEGLFRVIWSVLEPLLLYGLAIIAIGSFLLGVLAMLPLIRFKALLLFLVGALALGGAGYIYGGKIANREAELEAMRLELAKERADRELAQGALKAANDYARAQEAEVADREREGAEYERELEELRGRQAQPGKDGCDALDDLDLQHDPLRLRQR